MNAPRPIGKLIFATVIGVIGIGFIATLSWLWLNKNSDPPREMVWAAPDDDIERYPVTIRELREYILVDSGKHNARGEPIIVSCATCHDTREPSLATTNASQLDEFHQGLRYQHGNLSCLSCHNAGDYNTLKKSDGQALSFAESMKLCAQCHGPQHRDYQNGSHGGMTGYWDLSRGGRTRNHCIDCHDPHHPQYPIVNPVFPPKPVKGETLKHHE